jgi:hypothetical protein
MNNSKYQVVAISDYQMLKDNLARVIINCSSFMDKESITAKLVARLAGKAQPILSSFQWLNREKTQAVGYVTAFREVKTVESTTMAGFRCVEQASNLYMDESDKSLWEMKEGASGQFLARRGVDDLSSLIEQCRVAPRAGQPRCSMLQASVTASTAQQVAREMVGYCWASKFQAGTDYGFVLSSEENGDLNVLSVGSDKVEVVPQSQVFATVDISDMPKPTKAQAAAWDRTHGKETAAERTDSKLSIEDYYRLAYAYNPEYVQKIMLQIQDIAAV